jgi:hypothetical protein
MGKEVEELNGTIGLFAARVRWLEGVRARARICCPSVVSPVSLSRANQQRSPVRDARAHDVRYGRPGRTGVPAALGRDWASSPAHAPQPHRDGLATVVRPCPAAYAVRQWVVSRPSARRRPVVNARTTLRPAACAAPRPALNPGASPGRARPRCCAESRTYPPRWCPRTSAGTAPPRRRRRRRPSPAGTARPGRSGRDPTR